MSDRPRILLIDSSPSDIELAIRLLREACPQAEIATACDAASLLDALRGAAPDAVVLDPALAWAGLEQLIDLAGRTWPDGALVLFGSEATLLEQGLRPGLAVHGLARKDSAGYLALPELVRKILARRPAPAPGLEAFPLPSLRIEADGRIGAVNQACAAALAEPADELRGRPLAAVLAVEARAAWDAFRRGTTAQASFPLVVTALEVRLGRAADGSYVGCLLEPAPGTGDTRAPTAAPGTTSAPRELEELALVCSHDLKEPIQQVGRLVQRLEESVDTDPRVTEKTLRQLHDCAARANHMLNGLLGYLSVSTAVREDGVVDLNACLREALDNLAPAIAEAAAHIESESLPAVVGNAAQLTHLLQNLLSNAIKFHGANPPEIRVTATRAGDTLRLSVSDNGIGISSGQRERVFEMGRRLHTQDEYPGSGMGLALCRRIAQRHGGSIRIEDGSDGGSRFVVELPLPPRHVTRLA